MLFTLSPGHEKQVEADAASFRALNVNYGVDAQRAYFQGTPISDADASTFEAIGVYHGRDASRVFWRSRELERAGPSTFESLGFDYGRDGDVIFECGGVLAGVDARTFEVLYVGGERLAGQIDEGWAVLELAALRPLVAARAFTAAATAGDANAMIALAKSELDRCEAIEALVWARLVPVFGGKRQTKLEKQAWVMLDPDDEVPELKPTVALAVASKLASGGVPRRDDEIERVLRDAIRSGILTVTNTRRAALVDEFGEAVVVAAEAPPKKTGR